MELSEGLEGLFDRVSPQALGGEDWDVVFDNTSDQVSDRPGLRMAQRHLDSGFREHDTSQWLGGAEGGAAGVGKGVSVMRADLDLPLPFEDAVRLLRPEAMFFPRRCDFDREIAECGVDETIAPGDVVAWFRDHMTASLQRNTAVLGTTGASRQLGTRQVFRYMIRRDWPEPGQLCIAGAPMSEESGELLEDAGSMKATAAVILPHPIDPNKTKCIEVRRLANVPKWAISLMVDHYLKKADWASHFRASPFWQEATDGPANYMVVGIRKCPRGPPLLPRQNIFPSTAVTTTPSEWAAVAREGFELPDYLRSFLSLLGVEEEVHESLDGLRLVPYQAVVGRAAWERIWGSLEGPYKAMRAAYRQLHGGKHAPEITLHNTPHTRAHGAVVAPGVSRRQGPKPRHPVLRTFVHFGVGPDGAIFGQNPRPRTNSSPEIVLEAAAI